MKIEILDHRKPPYDAGEVLEFKLCDVDNSIANGLRRVLLAEIPTVAIDVVTVKKNSSVFPDEMLVHRLGLVPFLSKKAAHMNYIKDCSCNGNGCDLCQIVVHLNVKCSETDHSREIFSTELVSSDPEVYPIAGSEKGVWLLTLGRSQEFECKCYVRKGIAKLHSKWMPVATVSMQYCSQIDLNAEAFTRMDEGLRREWVTRCPRNVYEYDEKSQQVVVKNANACIYCKECLTTEAPFHDQPEALVVVRQKKSASGGYDFNFIVESTGVLPVMQLIYDAIEVMRKKLMVIQTVLNEGSTSSTANIPTRRVGIAPTAPVVADQDVVVRDDEEDNIKFVMS